MRAVRVSPLWLRAPQRAFRSGVAGLLLTVAITVGVASAASAPLFVESSGDDALRSVLATVPETALAKDAAVVRLVGGTSLRSEDQATYVDRMRMVPGLLPPQVTSVSVSPELLGSSYPVVRVGDTAVAVRFASVPDPASDVVPTGQASGQVWLPDPLAELLHVGPGDTVRLDMGGDPVFSTDPDVVPYGPVDVTVAGTYAVASDGRGPADPPGSTAWSSRRGDLPSSPDLPQLASWLVIGDAPTIERIADRTGDRQLWTVETQLDPSISLKAADATAVGVAQLRKLTMAPAGDEGGGALRTGVVSGIETLVAQADSLAAASARRATLWAGAGVTVGLVSVLAMALLGAADRRRELAHAVSAGVGPIRTGGLWALETVLPALLAAVLGIGLALLAVQILDADDRGIPQAIDEAVRAGAMVAGVAVVLVALVGVSALLLAQRPRRARAVPRAPWLGVLAVATLVAFLAATTGPAGAPGPVEIAVPILVGALAGTVAAVGCGLLLRGLTRRTRLPARPGSGRWLGLRRLAAVGAAQVLVVCAVTIGLSTAMFAAAAASATNSVVADRRAVAAGATSTARIDASWVLDRSAPKAPTDQEVEEGAKIPLGRTPTRPADQVIVWRGSVGIAGLFGYRDLLVADPQRLADVASWGRGPDLADIRSAVRRLGPPAKKGDPVPVIAVGEPSLKVGDIIVVSGVDWQVAAKVAASVDTFPDRGQVPMLVADDDAWFSRLGHHDPRLKAASTIGPPRSFNDVYIWSTQPVDRLVTELRAEKVEPSVTTSAEAVAQQPPLVAALFTRGYQAALAVFLVVAATVAAGLYAARTAGRQRAADLLLARVGLTQRGVRRARTWELTALVGTAVLGAVATVALVRPLGTMLLDLEPQAIPALHMSMGSPAWSALAVATVVVLAGALAVSWWDGRSTRRPGSSSSEEAVLRGAD